MFYLASPNISHQSRYLDMIQEWRDFETIPTSPKKLFAGNNYEEFLQEAVNGNESQEKNSLLFFMNDGDILGAGQLRYYLEHPIFMESGWYISYGLRPSVRGKGFAKEMLYLFLQYASMNEISMVKLSAYEDNPVSWKTIERCGGVFIKTFQKENGKELKVYSIII